MTRARVLALLAGLCAAAGCFSERERLDAPRVTLALDDTLVFPGGDVSGIMTAADASGIIFIAVRAETKDSAFRQRIDRIGEDSIEFAFRVHVSRAAEPGDTVLVEATAIDDQFFEITVIDTAYVRPLP
jgi:hypothetical protein